MSRVRSKNTKAELLLRRELHKCGYRFRIHYNRVIGTPDIAFTKPRLAIFVDGDFWHGRVLKERGLEALRESLKTENRDFWIGKISRNVERDLEVEKALSEIGWTAMRLWETDLKRDLCQGVRMIEEIVDPVNGGFVVPSDLLQAHGPALP